MTRRLIALALSSLAFSSVFSAPAFAAGSDEKDLQSIANVKIGSPVASIPECSEASGSALCKTQTPTPPLMHGSWIALKNTTQVIEGVPQTLEAEVQHGKIKQIAFIMTPTPEQASEVKRRFLAESKAKWGACRPEIDTLQANEKPDDALRMVLWKCGSTVAIYGGDAGQGRAWLALQ